MRIQTKFNTKQEVYLVKDNKVVSGEIVNVYASIYSYKDDSDSKNISYDLIIKDEVDVEEWGEEKLFATKEELAKHLCR